MTIAIVILAMIIAAMIGALVGIGILRVIAWAVYERKP